MTVADKVIVNTVAGTQLLINPVLITQAQVWRNQIKGAYEYLYPLVNDEFRNIEDDDKHTLVMALVPDTGGKTAPFKAWKTNILGKLKNLPHKILARIRLSLSGLKNTIFSFELDKSNKSE